MATVRKFEEDQPRADDGKWTAGGGGRGGGGGGGGSIGDRAKASLKDREFTARHRDRLKGAAARAREAGRRTDAEVDAEIAGEATRIQSEQEVDRAIEGHPDRERLQAAADDNRSDPSRSVGSDRTAEHAAVMAAVERTKAEIADEKAALDAGHVRPLPKEFVEAHETFAATRDAELGAIRDDLDGAHQAAVDTVSSLDKILEARDGEGSDAGLSPDDLKAVSDALGGASDRSYEASGDDYEAPEILNSDEPTLDDYRARYQEELEAYESESPDDPGDEPDRDDYYDDGEYESAVKEHKSAKDAMKEYEAGRPAETWKEDYKRDKDAYDAALKAQDDLIQERAGAAQDALEELHAKQTAALDRIKILGKDRDRLPEVDVDELVNDAALEGIDDEAQHERASSAAQSMLDEHARQQRKGIRDKYGDGSDDPVEDSHEALKEAAKSTAAAIRRMSKITGRAPSTGKPAAKPRKPSKTKKAANRPGADPGASVTAMARYKLRLSKLDFISPVDTPAQETARVLLIKRGDGAFATTANVAKVDESLGLVFCWAFTSTNPDGSAYHDLQGDAIDADFVKAAADFMASGGATDEMHDGQQTGRVVFAMPMTPEIAKAYGVETKTTGLMVALKPPADVLAKFKSGAYTGVSIAGTGVREVVKGGYGTTKKPKRRRSSYKRRVGKIAVLTSIDGGHQHTIDLEDPACHWSDCLSTSYQTADGAEQGHSHAWVYDPTTGAITVALDSGHTHTVEAVVPADVLAAAAAKEDEPLEPDASCTPCEPKHEDNATPGATVVVVSARAGAANSPPSQSTNTVKSEPKEPTAMATEQENKIAELEKRAARFEKMSTLTDAQRAHFSKLSGTEADAFLNKSNHERDLVVAEIAKADEVVYTSPISGRVFRKSHSHELIEMAKQLDEATTKQRAAEAAERDATFSKRGDETLTHFAKGAKNNLRARILKAINAEFTEPSEYEEAVTALKAANYALKSNTMPIGHGGDSDPSTNTAVAKLHAKVTELAKSMNVPYEVAFERGTATDPEIRALYNEAQADRN